VTPQQETKIQQTLKPTKTNKQTTKTNKQTTTGKITTSSWCIVTKHGSDRI